MDGNYISTDGVTAGLDGSLKIASILRGDMVAKEFQLEIEYAPDPPFHSGTPETAPPKVVRAFFARYGNVKILAMRRPGVSPRDSEQRNETGEARRARQSGPR